MVETRADPRNYQTGRAYFLGVFNGVVFAIGAAFADPATVLPNFVSHLTDSELAVGLISAIGTGGWYLPQLIAASYVQSRPRKRPVYIFASVLRCSGWLVVIPFVFAFGGRDAAITLAAFFFGYSLYAFGGGFGGVAFLDIVAKTVPPNRLGSFFGHRQFWGSLGGVAVGLLVCAILADNRLSFPYNYGLLFCLALSLFIPGWGAYCLVREPPGPVSEARPLLSFLWGARVFIRDHAEFRLLLLGRLLLGSATIALPFYIGYCKEALHAPEAAVGRYLSAQMIGGVVAVPLWAYLNDRRSPRTLILAVSSLSILAPGAAVALSLLPLPQAMIRVAFGLVFFGLGATGGGSFIGFTNYLFAIAPEERRTLYIGLLNTLFAVTMFLPIVGGLLVKYASFQLLFAVATAFSLAGTYAVFRLPPCNR